MQIISKAFNELNVNFTSMIILEIQISVDVLNLV